MRRTVNLYLSMMIFAVGCSSDKSPDAPGYVFDEGNFDVVVPSIDGKGGSPSSSDQNPDSTPPFSLEINSNPSLSIKFGEGGFGADQDVSLQNYTLHRYQGFGAGMWNLNGNNRSVLQTANGGASIYFDDNFNRSSYKLTARLNASIATDNDSSGVVFGMQDVNNYYLIFFRPEAGNRQGCNESAVGLTIKKVTRGMDNATGCDLWETQSSAPGGSNIIGTPNPGISLQNGGALLVEITFANDRYRVRVLNDANKNEMASYTINDNSFKTGKIGFFNFSMPDIRYSAKIAESSLEANDYEYQVTTNAPAGANILFTLEEGPQGMTIDAETGKLSWSKEDISMGMHSVKISVQDENDNVAEQSFTLTVAE